MRLLVLGAGAVGGYFGGRLAQAGRDVTFLVRPARADLLRSGGLRIESPLGNARIDARTVIQDTLTPEFDLVLLTCKAYDLDSAIEAIRPGLAPGGAVVPLLNGLSHIETLQGAFGPEAVIGGVARIAATLTPDGAIRHLADWQSLSFGELDGRESARVSGLAEMFAGVQGATASASSIIMQELWEKLVTLCTGGALTCMMRANIGEICRTPDGAAIAGRMLDAVAAVATAAGYPPRDAALASNRRMFSDPASSFQTSMARDLEQGARIEGDHIVGYVLARARDFGLDDTLLSVAHTHLRAYEQRRAAGRL
jgi:2-dehydropantoate 2-reductase